MVDMILFIRMVSNTTHRTRHAVKMSSNSHRFHQFLLFSGVASMMPTTITAFVSINNNHHCSYLHPAISLMQCRAVHLPKRSSLQHLYSSTNDEQSTSNSNSVTGSIYEAADTNAPTIKLFTKEGCTLCDKVKDSLSQLQNDYPHSLYAVDITDEDKQMWFDKYKYDIPVLHMNDVYWTKHRLSEEEAIKGIEEAVGGMFVEGRGEPDASRLEHW